MAEQTVLVTGAAQGLGQAIARAFHGSGARVAALDVDAAGLAALESELGDRLHIYPADLADAEATQAVAAQVVEALGTVHTLIHNAAILEPTPFEATTFGEWQRTVNVGLQAAFLLTHALWTGMKANGGVVVYVSSRSGIEGFAEESAYCAAKHGLEGLMKSLALEGSPNGILVHTVTPGMYMRTPMSERNYPDDLKTKWVEPDALAPAFLKLAARSDPALTGQRLSAWELAHKE